MPVDHLHRPNRTQARLRGGALLLSASLAMPALAAPASPLQDAAARLPAGLFTDPQAGMVRFVDVAVVGSLAGTPLGPDGLKRVSLAQGMAPLMALASGDAQIWEKHTGVPIGQLTYVVGFGTPPAEFSLWGLQRESDAQALIAGLPERGFKRSGSAWANGADQAMDIASREPANPWRGLMGRTAAVAAVDNVIVQGSAARAVAQIATAIRKPADGPATVIAAGVQSLDGDVLQALMFGPSHGLAPGVDPARLLGQSPAQARQTVEAAAAEPPMGVPPYGAAMLADMQGEAGARLVIAFAYDDCALAERAAAAAARVWQAAVPDGQAAEPPTTATHAADGGCAALVSVIDNQTDGHRIHPAFQRTLDQFQRRQLDVIRIGAAP